MVEFRILGPVEAAASGRLIRLGSRRERVVLAALVLAGGDVISTDRLIDVLWGNDPPRSAGKTLQNYVLRLRKALGPAAIETRAPGYRLAAEAARIDAFRFDQLIRQATEARLGGRPEEAAGALREALGMWRGAPLEELEGWVLADAEAVRLAELRRVAMEDLVDAEMACGRSAQVVAELEAMVATEPLRERRWGMLMLALYRCGRQADALRVYQRARTLLGDELGIEPGPELRSLEGAIAAQDPSLNWVADDVADADGSDDDADADGSDDPSGFCAPYKGLAPFEADDRALFFGRTDLVADLVARTRATRFMALVGASGSGKSSVVRAGVLPFLRDGPPGDPGAWAAMVMNPGVRPLVELATGLAPVVERAVPDVLERLEADPHGLADLAAAAIGRDAQLAIVVDQFEEIFTLTRDSVERQRFVGAIVDAVQEVGGRVTVVLALRADFYGHCAAFPELARLLDVGSILICPMEPDELREAVTGPAESAGLRVEPGFVELVVQDVRAEPGALPLLSHALLETWKRRSRRTLTVAGYLDAGGAKGAIAQTAESVYRAFDHDEQVRARHIFLRLTELGDGTEDTARRMERNELAPSIDGPVTDRVLERMVDARLVTLDDHSAQVAHEALIREWPRLRGWLDEDREGRRVHRHLTHAARDWQALGFDAGELYRGTRLAALRDWATESGNGAELNALETDFLGASIAREEDERASQLDQVRAREHSNRRLRRLLAVTAVVLGVALVAGTLAFVQRGRADDEAAAARSASRGATADRLVAQSNVQEGENRYLGALLALEADRIHDGPQARGAIFSALLEEPRRVLTMPTGPASDVAPLADGTALVLADGHVERWDLHLGTRLARWPGPAVAALAVSSAGLVAEGRVDGSIAFVDLSGHPREDAIPAGADGAPGVGSVPSDLAFSPDGQRLAVSYGVFGDPRQIDGARSVRVYVVVTGHALATRYGGHTGTVTTVAFSPDGRELLTGGNDDQVVLHDAASGAPVGPPLAMGGLVWSARFDPRGRRIAVGTSSGGASVVDLDTGIRHMLGQGTDADAAWSADGSRLAVGGNGSLQVYDAATLIADAPPIDVQTGTTSPRFTTDGRILVAGRGGPTTLWDLDGRSPLARTVPGAPAYVFPMAGDRVVAVPDIGDSVTLYDAKTLVPLGPALSPGPGPPSALPYPTTFAASYYHGNRIAVVNRAGTLQLYEVPSGRAIGAPYALGFSTVYAIFSRDMHTIAVGGRDGEVALVDLPSRRVRRLTSELDNYVDALAFTPSGDLVAADGGHAVWFRRLDRSTPEVRDLSRFTRASGVPTGSDLSPDGRTLAISAGGSVSFVELATERRIGPPVRVSDDSINWLAFSLDGSMIVTSDSSRTSRLVDVATRQLVGPKLPINVFTGPVFSGDSKTLGTSTPAGDPQPTGALLSVDPAVWRREACQLAGRNLTAAEWAKYLPGQGPRQKTCPDYL